MWTKSQLANPVNVGIIENYKSYWASHFYSVLECLHSHKTMNHSPMNLRSYPNWSLSEMRGDLPLNFFNELESYIRNWGFQYFLSVFMNNKMSSEIVEQLVKNLSDLYNANFSTNFNNYAFYISGHDSALSHGLLDRFTEVFPPELRENKPDSSILIAQSDLCLILTSPKTNNKVAIFGEVEGTYGSDMSNQSYWRNKLDFCVFTVGVIEGSGKGTYVANSCLNGIDRVNILFEKKHPVVADFQTVLNFMKILFVEGPSTKIQLRDEEFDYFFNKVKSYWKRPILDLINDMQSYFERSQVIGFMKNKISIITDIQA